MAKSAFRGNDAYDANNALSISQAKLDEFKVDHVKITGRQHHHYSNFNKTGKQLTFDDMRKIEIQSMVDVGVPVEYATNAVDKAIADLLKSGVKGPTRIPWGKGD